MIPKINVDGLLTWAAVGLVLTAILSGLGIAVLVYYVFQHIRFV